MKWIVTLSEIGRKWPEAWKCVSLESTERKNFAWHKNLAHVAYASLNLFSIPARIRKSQFAPKNETVKVMNANRNVGWMNSCISEKANKFSFLVQNSPDGLVGAMIRVYRGTTCPGYRPVGTWSFPDPVGEECGSACTGDVVRRPGEKSSDKRTVKNVDA